MSRTDLIMTSVPPLRGSDSVVSRFGLEVSQPMSVSHIAGPKLLKEYLPQYDKHRFELTKYSPAYARLPRARQSSPPPPLSLANQAHLPTLRKAAHPEGNICNAQTVVLRKPNRPINEYSIHFSRAHPQDYLPDASQGLIPGQFYRPRFAIGGSLTAW